MTDRSGGLLVVDKPAGVAFAAARASSSSRARVWATRSSRWAAPSGSASAMNSIDGVRRMPMPLPTAERMRPLLASSTSAVAWRSSLLPKTV